MISKRHAPGDILQPKSNRMEYHKAKLFSLKFMIPNHIADEEYQDVDISYYKCINTMLRKEVERFNILIKQLKFNIGKTL